MAYGHGTVNIEIKVNSKWDSVRCRVRLKGVRTVHGLYALEIRVLYPKVCVAAEVCVASADQSLQLWHERLCHQNKAHVKDILRKYQIKGDAKDSQICDGCCYGKQSRRPFGTRKQRATTPGELINIDVCGPMQQQSLGGAKYYVCFKDDFTKYRRVFFMQSKNEVSKCLETFLNEAKNTGHMIKEVLSDGGGEVINSTVKSLLEKSGISFNMDKRSEQGILSRDVIFQNKKLSCVPDVSSTDIQNSDMEIVKKPLQTPEADVEKEMEEISCNAEDTEETLVQQSSRNLRDRSILKMPAKFDSFVLLAEHIEPETYKEAMASEDSDKWLAAMKEELESLSNNNTWILVNLPSDRKAIVNECQNLLKESKRPLILLGSQALIPPTAAEKLKKALETLQIPCFLGGMARGLLGRHSSLHIRQKRREALQEADLVILAGSVCDFRLSYGRVLNPKSKIIAVNRDKTQLHKNSGVFWKPTLAIQACSSDFIIKLAEKSSSYLQNDWLLKLQQRDVETEAKNKEKINKKDSRYLDPLHLLYKLEEILPENVVMVADGGDFVATSSYILRPRGQLRWLDPGAFGTLGVGAGFALGAKLCYPNAHVLILYGDGSCGYSLIEFDTFVRHKLPIVAIVGNDACWSQIAREQIPRFHSSVACDLTFTDYHKVVDGLGGKGIILSGDDIRHLESKLIAAFDLSKGGDSVLVNALLGKTDFRSGSISI
ncbi:2-hydroxyacyl-CoA lyase 2 [Trichonephila clavata]|uniref:2-hydroxyacyl-CoA lyase 2 n=1 Tax=Trichonephila clavata TaxID=2740835 RepID=A0A8X6HNX0_TRICU|nr:2-hydroxyacyl-CoA lyase 2 [Trichonephila clavata]